MENENKNVNLGEEIHTWIVPEYIKHVRTKRWYIIAILGALFLLIFAFFTANFLFAVIVVVASLIIFLNDKQEPEQVQISIMGTGIIVGRKFYDYDDFKTFSLIYKPQDNVRNLYFEFNNGLKQRISIPLENENPLQIRDDLLKYLPEDLERINQPLSEGLARIFKI